MMHGAAVSIKLPGVPRSYLFFVLVADRIDTAERLDIFSSKLRQDCLKGPGNALSVRSMKPRGAVLKRQVLGPIRGADVKD